MEDYLINPKSVIRCNETNILSLQISYGVQNVHIFLIVWLYTIPKK